MNSFNQKQVSSGVGRRAIITGISGQDGRYIVDALSVRGYLLHGVSRSADKLRDQTQLNDSRLTLHALPETSFSDQKSRWEELIAEIQPHELYHFAADSFIPNGWSRPLGNIYSNFALTVRTLEAVRKHSPNTKVLNACSREIFAGTSVRFANEKTELSPISPYGVNKAASWWMVKAYRQKYGLFAVNAILFNHESPRRPERFVTRKISKRAAEIAVGLEQKLELGSLSAARDWGYAGDFVEAMWRMLQLDTPEDFVLGTGVVHSIEEFARAAFAHCGLNWSDYVVSTPSLVRSHDPAGIRADISKAKRLLGWQPSVSFEQLVAMMVDYDLRLAREQVAASRRAA